MPGLLEGCPLRYAAASYVVKSNSEEAGKSVILTPSERVECSIEPTDQRMAACVAKAGHHDPMADICIEDCRIPNPDLTVQGSGNAIRNHNGDQQTSTISQPVCYGDHARSGSYSRSSLGSDGCSARSYRSLG